MKGFSKVINIEEYLQLKNWVESQEKSKPEYTSPAQVFDFVEFHQKDRIQKILRQKAKARALSLIEILAALNKDYEAQMLVVANQRTRKEWQEEFNTDPYGQIEFDMRRLHRFAEALKEAILLKDSATLTEAAQEISKSTDPEILTTLEYIQTSDYTGFEAMKRVLSIGELKAEEYVEDFLELCEILKALKESHFVYAIAPLSALCLEEAIAV